MNLFHTGPHMSFKRTLSIAGLSLSIAGFANAEVESSISASHDSKYNFRGENAGEDAFSFAYNVSTNAAGLDWDLALEQISSDLTDIESYRIGAAKGLGDQLALRVGLEHHNFSLRNSFLSNLTVGLSSTLAGLDLGATAFYDLTSNDDPDYYEFSAAKHFCLGDGLSAEVSVLHGEIKGRGNYRTASLGLSKQLSDQVAASVHYTYVDSLGFRDEDSLFGLSISVDL